MDLKSTKMEASPNPTPTRKPFAMLRPCGYVSMAWENGENTCTLTPYFRATDMRFLMHFLPGKPLEENDHGIPQLSEALAFLACKVTGSVAAGDHIVYVAEVIDGVLQDDSGTPMVRIRRNGFGY